MSKTMSNEPNKPTEAQKLTEKELEDIVGGKNALLSLGDKMILGTTVVPMVKIK